MIEHGHIPGDHRWVMVGEADRAAAELDGLGAVDERGEEDQRRSDRLGRGRVVLADPHLRKTELVREDDLVGGLLVNLPLAAWRRMYRLKEHSKVQHGNCPYFLL
jgi:hypothetical protein